jgi:hypothetical protein
MHNGTPKEGIILRIKPENQRITLLDSVDGKRMLLFSSYAPVGALITYSVLIKLSIPRLILHELCAVPLKVAARSLHFLHYALALCDVGIPLGSCVHEAYNILAWLCQENAILSGVQKDFFLAKLIMVLGLHTTQSYLCERCARVIRAMSVDTLSMVALELDCCTHLPRWIQQCLEEYVIGAGQERTPDKYAG